MKVAVQRLLVETVELELPEVCPHCGADFRAPASLFEDGWIACEDACRIVDNSNGPEIGGYDSPKDLWDARLVVGYTCAACRKTVVSTEAAGRDGSGGDGKAS